MFPSSSHLAQAEPRAQLSLASRQASNALKIIPNDLVLYSAKVGAALACVCVAGLGLPGGNQFNIIPNDRVL